MSLTVELPEELAERLTAEAARGGTSVGELVVSLLAGRLAIEDPLEEFIGSGSSGRGDLGRQHREIRAERTKGIAARDL